MIGKEDKGDFLDTRRSSQEDQILVRTLQFFSDLYKQAVEGMLKAELKEHLGYERHQSKTNLAITAGLFLQENPEDQYWRHPPGCTPGP